jgi:hypothetical protein
MLGVDKLKKSVQDMLGTVANLPEDVRDNAKQFLVDIDESDRAEAILRDAVRGALETAGEYELVISLRKK